MKLEKYITEEDLFFEEASLSPKTTGLPMAIYVSAKGNSKYFARIKASSKRSDKLKQDSLFTITISEEPAVIGEIRDLTTKDIEQLVSFVVKNRKALLEYWNEEIDTAELIKKIN